MKIEVVEYDPEWVHRFEEERDRLLEILPDSKIHHIGSTSVPGLPAKPIIDILIEVDGIDSLDALSKEFEALGYEVMGEFGIPGRRYFRKGGDDRSHHIHCFGNDDPGIHRHLAFRDYLIVHPAIAEEYATLKQRLAGEPNASNDSYCDGKDDFVQLHEARALEWAAKR